MQIMSKPTSEFGMMQSLELFGVPLTGVGEACGLREFEIIDQEDTGGT